jgi:hypothetical protein
VQATGGILVLLDSLWVRLILPGWPFLAYIKSNLPISINIG